MRASRRRGPADDDTGGQDDAAGQPPVRGLPSATLERIAALATQKGYRRGEIVFSAGDVGDALFGVVSGRIRISAGNADGREMFLNIMEAGDTSRDGASRRRDAHGDGNGDRPSDCVDPARAVLRAARAGAQSGARGLAAVRRAAALDQRPAWRMRRSSMRPRGLPSAFSRCASCMARQRRPGSADLAGGARRVPGVSRRAV